MIAKKIMKATEGVAALSKSSVRRLLGQRQQFEIFAGYNHRPAGAYFDDTENDDGWQKEVYLAAREIMQSNGLQTIYDVGCGSAFKLVHILGDYDTTGFDVPQTIDVIRTRYPERKWRPADLADTSIPKADLVICSDVIEHVDDPDALMRFITNCASDWIVISTPDRDIVYKYRYLNKYYYGPPANKTHIREWSTREFKRYVSWFLNIERHEITNNEHATQMIVGRVRRT